MRPILYSSVEFAGKATATQSASDTARVCNQRSVLQDLPQIPQVFGHEDATEQRTNPSQEIQEHKKVNPMVGQDSIYTPRKRIHKDFQKNQSNSNTLL
jgi:hypothetical protein